MSYRRPGTLPPQTSEFVGRTAELAQTRELLRDSRLVTITGPGGVGKTRLAVQAASGVAEAYRDGAHLIELSTTRDPESLVQALAAGLALADHPGTEPSTGSGTESSTESHTGSGTQLDTVLGYLRERELLLILDTCEPVIDACAALTDIVLREAPGVTILATSRQPLDTAGEAVQRLRPLPVPAAGSPGAGRADAVELFALRAAAAVPGFTVTPKNLGDVITVCRRLDGIPLAIELATVRLSALPLHEMAARLGDRLRSLTGERRSGTPRHRTLRAAIEWSYALCTPAEQALWARLSVFADGFDLRAAEAVCSGGELAGEETVSAVISLVDKSLLAAGTTPDADPAAAGQPQAPTFRMLDTIREFGAERLRRADTRTLASPRAGRAERGTANRTRVGRAEASLRGRFIAHYLTLAEDFERDPVNGQLGKLQRLSREQANLHAAFEYALGMRGDEGAAIVLATSLCYYWHISGQLREAERWLDQAAERCPKRSVARARVLAARGYSRVHRGDLANGSADAEAAIAMAAPFTDRATAARGYATLCTALTFGKNPAAAQAAAAAAAECYTSIGDAFGLARLDLLDSLLRLQNGELDRCYAGAARGLDRLPEDEIWCSSSLYGLQSLVLFLRGDLGRATPTGLLTLMMKQRIHDQAGVANGLSTLAFIAAGQGRCGRAAWLFGAAGALWDQTGRWHQGNPAVESLRRVTERIVRAGLGDDRYRELRTAGASVPLDHAIRRAFADADELGEGTTRRPATWR